MTPSGFTDLVARVTARIEGRTLDQRLEDDLEAMFPVDSPEFRALADACRAGVAAGWMCTQGGPGRRFGRVLEATPATHGLSVDVVELEEIVGPHHRHPRGEICLVLPVDAPARFDGRGAGWVVYGPGSAHRPTVAGGKALVLYLLPGGAIEFTKT